MGRSVLWEGSGGGGAPGQCADVVFNPDSGVSPLTVTVSTATANAHIFYRTKLDPQHAGDNAVAPTVRIGSNSGTISVRSGPIIIRAVAYEPTHTDSNITEGDYDSGL